MSIYTENETYFPNLPGYRSKIKQNTSKRSTLKIISGLTIVSNDTLQNNSDAYDILNQTSTSLMSSTSSLKPKPKIRATRQYSGVALNFLAYFEEDVFYSTKSDEQKRVRVCHIYYFPENGCITIVEKQEPNSGIPQGTLVKKDMIYKPNGDLITPEDLAPGNDVEIYRRKYTIADCDEYTKNFLYHEYNLPYIQALPIPQDNYSAYRSQVEHGPSDAWDKYRSKKSANKNFIEAKLGNFVDNSGRDGFIKYGNMKLQFSCVWDNTDKLYGDLCEYRLVYHLSDDTVEIFSASSQPAFQLTRGENSKLLRKSKLPKSALVSASNNIGAANEDYYHWTDLQVGNTLNVYSRMLRIVDADSRTREFYSENGRELDYVDYSSTNQPEAFILPTERVIPPSTGFGSEEDSLRSCMGSLQIHVPTYKKHGENKVLSFSARMVGGNQDVYSENADRRFVLMYYVHDGTLKILEPPIRNSGFIGGTFLSRRSYKLPNNETLNEVHLYVGAKVNVMNNIFLLTETNDLTLRWMEEHANYLPKSNISSIVSKIRPFLINDVQSGKLAELFEYYNVQGAGVTISGLREVLISYGLLEKIESSNYEEGVLVDHEVMSLFRADGNRSEYMDYNTFLDLIANSPADDVY